MNKRKERQFVLCKRHAFSILMWSPTKFIQPPTWRGQKASNFYERPFHSLICIFECAELLTILCVRTGIGQASLRESWFKWKAGFRRTSLSRWSRQAPPSLCDDCWTAETIFVNNIFFSEIIRTEDSFEVRPVSSFETHLPHRLSPANLMRGRSCGQFSGKFDLVWWEAV